MLGVGPVAVVAVLGQDRPDVAIELHTISCEPAVDESEAESDGENRPGENEGHGKENTVGTAGIFLP